MSLAMHHVVIDCHSPSSLVKFWAEALDYEFEDWGNTNGAVAFNPADRQLRLLFLPVPESKTVKNRLHIDMETEDNTMDAEVSRLRGLGASMIEQREMVMETWTSVWTVMSDPEGNEFCVSRKPTDDQPR